jgi:hypothetical protein
MRWGALLGTSLIALAGAGGGISAGATPHHHRSHCIPEPHINLAVHRGRHHHKRSARRVCTPKGNPALHLPPVQLGGGAYPNARIAEVGLARLGQYGGQCKEAVNIWVAIASNGTQHLGGDYLANYRAQGGSEVGRDAAVAGDVIQLNGPDGRYYYEGMHTAVVVSHAAGSSNFLVVDSNWNWHETVTRHEWNPYASAAAHGLSVHIWRMGSAGSPPSPPPPPEPGGPGTPRGNPHAPGEALWRIRNLASPGPPDVEYSFGGHASIPVVGDWTGSGTDTLGVFTQEAGGDRWQLRTEPGPGPAQIEFRYGGITDLPVVGDWNGSGKDGIGVFTPGSAVWRLRNTPTPGDPEIAYQYGGSTDLPVVGAWLGGKTDGTGAFTPGSALWRLRNTPTPGPPEIQYQYGGPDDLPVVGDWSGLGSASTGVFTPGSALWRLRNSATTGDPELQYQYGGPYDEPVVGDWAGVGHDGTGVFTPPR